MLDSAISVNRGDAVGVHYPVGTRRGVIPYEENYRTSVTPGIYIVWPLVKTALILKFMVIVYNVINIKVSFSLLI